MPTVLHSTLTGSNSHEPKGVESADAGDIYEADGAGSGAWVSAQSTGVEDLQNSGGQLATTSGVPKQLEIDGVGFGYTDFIPGRTSIWDLDNNEMDLGAAGWLVGDTAILRIGVTVVSAGANAIFELAVDFAVGGSVPFELQVSSFYEKSAGTHEHSFNFPFYISSQDVLDYPARIMLTTDSSSNTGKLHGVTAFHYPKLLVRS